MKFFLRLIFLIPICFFGIIAVRIFLDNKPIRFGDDLFGGNLGLFSISILGITIFFIERHYYYRKEKKIGQFAVTGVSILAFILMLLPIARQEWTDSSATVLEVNKGWMSFEFKENNKFKLVKGEGLSAVVYYGEYSRIDDTIHIHKSNYDGDVKDLPLKIVIENGFVIWNNLDTVKISR
jgi:hypothetical protein